MATYPIEAWKAQPQPYCLLSYSNSAGNYRPRGQRRYATVDEALAHAKQLDPTCGGTGHMLLVDYAGAYEAASHARQDA